MDASKVASVVAGRATASMEQAPSSIISQKNADTFKSLRQIVFDLRDSAETAPQCCKEALDLCKHVIGQAAKLEGDVIRQFECAIKTDWYPDLVSCV
jgi:hypothetical protein